MNKKAGIYTGAIALAAMAIIATIAFNGISGAWAQGEGEAKAILDFKWEAQNAQHVAGKAIADALADASYSETSCGYSHDEALYNISTYLASQAMRDAFQGCAFSDVSVDDSAPPNVLVSVKLSCGKSTGGNMRMAYEKTLAFSKRVQASGSCTIIVTDIDTGEEEVNQAM
jgi:hypothetical protein